MTALRVLLPVSIAVPGLVLIGVGMARFGGALNGAGLMVLAANGVLRPGPDSRADRDREEEARRQYARTGRWPAA